MMRNRSDGFLVARVQNCPCGMSSGLTVCGVFLLQSSLQAPARRYLIPTVALLILTFFLGVFPARGLTVPVLCLVQSHLEGGVCSRGTSIQQARQSDL